MERIISCRVDEDTALLTTDLTLSQNREPFAISLRYNERLRDLYHRVKVEVMQILNSASERKSPSLGQEP